MTNHWIDLKHTDCALIIGSNAAENHPISFKWLGEARKNRGAKIIHVDPRYTRTSALSDVYAKLRSGTDIAFIGGLINYTLQNELYQKEYVVNYTNAAFIINDGYKYEDGIFTGYDAKTRKYDQTTWVYKTDEEGNPLKDETLQNPRCVYQLLKKHYERYDLETVSQVTGTPIADYKKVAETYCATGEKGKSGTIMYAMGTTQHTVGSQNVRSYAMLQLLLGNIGMPGGGVNALRGEANVQGSTDMGLLFHIYPGYNPSVQASERNATLQAYIDNETPAGGYWVNRPKFMVSFLKALWGPKATDENEFAYHYLPKRDPAKNYSHIALFEAMHAGDIKGAFLFGQNPVVGGPNAHKEREALEKLDWMVAVDLWETETMAFWSKDAGAKPENIKTEVFVLPACSSFEKEGSISNSGRWAQWRWKATEPIGESKADLEIIHALTLRLKKAYAKSDKPQDAPIRDLFWNYGHSEEHCDIDAVAREINGYDTTTGKQLLNFTELKDDGTTCSGNWIYSGQYPEEGNLLKRRDNNDPSGMGNYNNWSWCWPVNRRILYNRAAADLDGKPWADDKKTIWWDGTTWGGNDVPDFNKVIPPTEPGGNSPFIMQADGKGGLFAKMAEGPFPEHYEPWESPKENPFNSQPFNPAVKEWEPEKRGKKDKYPIVCTTYRVSEHWQTGVMTRNLGWQAELVPEMFVEISKELAEEKGIKNGDKVIIEATRGAIEAKAMVTERFKPYDLGGQKVHHIGLPWHFGYRGIVTGGIANILTPHIGDANTMIPEYKAFLVNLRRAK